jgi:hypothetical protein
MRETVVFNYFTPLASALQRENRNGGENKNQDPSFKNQINPKLKIKNVKERQF